MSRMSAKYVAQKVGMSVKWVYDLWSKMGIVAKDKLGDWALTESGRQLGGRMSKSNYHPVPTFDFDKLEPLMIKFYKKNK